MARLVVFCAGAIALGLPGTVQAQPPGQPMVSPVERTSESHLPASARLSTLGDVGPTSRSAGSQEATTDVALPANLHVDNRLRPLVELMWQRSPTFARRCARLAKAKVSVTVRLDLLRSKPARAWSRFEVKHNGLTHAEVRIDMRHRRDAVELIAHELEHLIELLDGVDHASQVERGAATRTRDGRYETTRAVDIGRRVAHETRRASEPLGEEHARGEQ